MKKNNAFSLLSSFSIVLLWFISSKLIGSEIILPSPLDVIKAFNSNGFFKHILATVLRALESFLVIVVSGTVLGILAGKSRIVEKTISPFVTVFKATPIMSIILILFSWLKTNLIPVFSAFLMAFPIMFVQILSGYRSIDQKLIQMCDVYEINGKRRLAYLTVPSLIPAFITGSRQTLSMIWKVVIASEVLTLPKNGIGRAMQLAQIQLQTSTVFAWTLVAVLLTWLSNLCFDFLMKKTFGRRFSDAS